VITVGRIVEAVVVVIMDIDRPAGSVAIIVADVVARAITGIVEGPYELP
jgi:hypothetical protein